MNVPFWSEGEGSLAVSVKVASTWAVAEVGPEMVAVGGGPWNWKAPKSGGELTGKPRWSVAMPAAPLPRAGLPGSRAMVWVGPPFQASGPSFGSPVIAPARPPLPSPMRLLLPASGLPLLRISPPEVFLATMVLFIVTVVMPALPRPPPLAMAELPAMVQLTSVSVLWFRMPPPLLAAELPATVQSDIFSVPPVLKMPPPERPAVLAATVQSLIVRTPPLKRPPP